MTLRLRSSFERDLLTIADREVLRRVARSIEQVEAARDLAEVPGLKRMRGRPGYGRIRVGDYRIGCGIEQDAVGFAGRLHRRDIDRHFP